MKETFEKEEINVNLSKIEDSNPKNINLNYIIGLPYFWAAGNNFNWLISSSIFSRSAG